jgi:hypothetical protein
LEENDSLFGIPLDELDRSKVVPPSDDVPFYPVLDPTFGTCYQFRPETDTNRAVKTTGTVLVFEQKFVLQNQLLDPR